MARRKDDEERKLQSSIIDSREELKLENMHQQLESVSGGEPEFAAKAAGARAPFKMAESKAIEIGGTVALDKLYGKSEPGGIHKILGVNSPSGGADTNLFTVLAAHTCRVSVLWAANRRLVKAKVRIGFDVGGNGTNTVPDAAWLYYNVEVPGESTLVLDAATGLWLGALDDVVVRTDLSGVSFGASGSEYVTA